MKLMSIDVGAMHEASWKEDPKHLLFVLARYAFVARMLAGKDNVLEVGCGDGTGARLVEPVVGRLYGIDREKQPKFPGHFVHWDIVDEDTHLLAWNGEMDAVYALDVLEHIRPEDEDIALANMAGFLAAGGVCIVGMPSLESQPYASENSRREHVNCKTENGLRELMQRYFRNVFMFGMQDATLHTGFDRMVHYRLALAVGPK